MLSNLEVGAKQISLYDKKKNFYYFLSKVIDTQQVICFKAQRKLETK